MTFRRPQWYFGTWIIHFITSYLSLRSPFGQPLSLSHVLVFSPQSNLRGNDFQEIESCSRGEPYIETFMPTSVVTCWIPEPMLLLSLLSLRFEFHLTLILTFFQCVYEWLRLVYSHCWDFCSLRQFSWQQFGELRGTGTHTMVVGSEIYWGKCKRRKLSGVYGAPSSSHPRRGLQWSGRHNCHTAGAELPDQERGQLSHCC